MLLLVRTGWWGWAELAPLPHHLHPALGIGQDGTGLPLPTLPARRWGCWAVRRRALWYQPKDPKKWGWARSKELHTRMCTTEDHSPYGAKGQSSSSFEAQAAGEWEGTHQVQSDKMFSSVSSPRTLHKMDGIQEMDQDGDLARPVRKDPCLTREIESSEGLQPLEGWAGC